MGSSPTRQRARGPTVGPVDDHARIDEDRALSVRLDVHLDRQPVVGRLRPEQGQDEPFVGWLGFVDALRRLHDARDAATRGKELT